MGFSNRARGRKTQFGRAESILVTFLLLLNTILMVAVPAIGTASDWGEQVGDVHLQHSWGHGSSTNLTLTNVTLGGGVFKLAKSTNSTFLNEQDLKDGTKTDVVLTIDTSLVLSVVAPLWSSRGAWDINKVDQVLGSPTPVLGDIDNDGDLDAYVGIENGTVAGYNNTGDNTAPVWTIQGSWNYSFTSTFAVPALGDLDADGDLDMVVGDNDGTSYGFNNTGDKTWPSWTAKPGWDLPDVGNGGAPAFADIDDDGDLDVYVGNSAGRTRAYENIGDSTSPSWSRNNSWEPPNQGGVANPSLADLDGDGDLDLLLGDGVGNTYAYENTGSVTSPTWTARAAWDIPADVGDYASPALGDVDADGDMDAFIGEWLGDSYAYENTGSRANNGNYYSLAFGIGHAVDWTSINWSEVLPGNTDATFYVRTGNTTDPTDGTWGSWTSGLSTPGGSSITSPPGSYIQVRVYLETTNVANTPEVSDIGLSYEFVEPAGTIETTDLSPTDLIKWVSFDMVNDSKGQGTDVYYSTNSGSAWTLVPSDGNLSAVGTASGKIRFRANLTSSDYLTSPELTGINVTYMKLLNDHHLHLSPVLIEVEVGDTYDLAAELHDINNNTLDQVLSWTTTVGTVDGSGNFTAQTTPGVGFINVSYGNLLASAQVTVKLGPLDTLNITPSALVLEVGDVAQASVKGFDKYDNELPGLEFNWSTDAGTVDPTTGPGTNLTAQTTPGTGSLNVSVGNIITSIPVTVNRGPLVSIEISPSKMVANESLSLQVSAEGYDKYNNKIPALDFNWSSAVGTFDPVLGASTTFTAQEVDDNLTNQTVNGNLTADHGAISSTIDVTVQGQFVQWLTRLVVEPTSISLLPVETATFNVTCYDQFDDPMNASTTWTSDVGTLSPSTGPTSTLTPNIDEGVGVVTVSAGDISVSADVTIQANDTYPFPKIFGEVPDQVKFEDGPAWTIDLNRFETGGLTDDGLLWHLEGVDTSLVTVSGDYDVNDILILVPVPDANGQNLVTLVLEDTKGFNDTQQMWINLTPVDDPPLLSPVPDLMIRYDDPYTFNYEPYINDIDTAFENIILTVPKAEPEEPTLDISVNGLMVTYSAPKALVDKSFTVTISITDVTTTVTDTLNLIISDNYVPQLILPLPDIKLREGELKIGVFDLDDHFLDKDKDVMFFTYGNNHITIIINEDHTVDIEASSQWNGQELVTFRATDSKGSLVEDNVLVTVIPFDDAPMISDVPDLIVHFDDFYQFDLTPYIDDVDTPVEGLTLSFSEEHVWWSWDPEMVLLHPPKTGTTKMTMVMNFPNELDGQTAPYDVHVTITVMDGSSQDTDTIKITVTNNWPPEVSKQIPDVEFDEDTMLTNAFKLTDHFNDKDGQQLTFSVIAEVLTVRINNDYTVDISGPEDWNGIEQITFRATDSEGAMIEDSIVAVVRPVNDPPVLDPIGLQTMEEKTLLTVDLKDVVHDVDHGITELSIVITSSDLALNAFVTGTSILVFGNSPGNYTVTVKVSDPTGASSEISFQVDVTKAEGNGPSPITNDLFGQMLLPIILLLVILGAVGGYMGYRRYFGRFDIEEAFVILRDGRLVAHMSKYKVTEKDKTTFSGMIAAVQLFIEDTFKTKKGGKKTSTIQKMEFKGNTIMIERGKIIYLAILLKGKAGTKIDSDMAALLEKLEERHGAVLKEWDGDVADLRDLSFDLMDLIPDGYSQTLPDMDK